MIKLLLLAFLLMGFSPRWEMIAVHYSVSTHMTKKECDAWHTERGFEGCGYHFIIDRDGKVEPGRSLNRIGAHAYEFNSRAIGVCFVSQGDISPQQVTSFKNLVQKLEEQFGELPIVLHREIGKTKCPGDEIAQTIKALK